jgi:hypothetical protein
MEYISNINNNLKSEIMRTLKQITDSLITSYNNNERPNFVDLRDLEIYTTEQES